MTRRRIFACGTAFAVLILVAIMVWLRGSNLAPSSEATQVTARAEPDVNRTLGAAAVTGESDAVSNSEDAITVSEYFRTHVKLPLPENGPWATAFLTNTSALEARNKGTAVDVLQLWIRNALESGRSDLAARYLATLMTLASDDSPAIAGPATIAIYRLGDSDNFALKAMARWIESGSDFWSSGGAYAGPGGMDIRARVLKELSYYGDHRLDDVIQNVWLAGLAKEAELLPKVDYAYYLETHGRPMSVDYWLSRIEMWQGARNTFAVLQAAAPAGLAEQLSAFFSAHAAKPPDGHYAERVALAASWLAVQTDRPEYLNYLLKTAGSQMAADRYDRNFSLVLQGLASTHRPEALELIGQLIAHENRGLQNTAAEALGFAGPTALSLLVQDATHRAQTGQGFPGAAMKAMLELRTPEADAAYLRLKTALLSGGAGWQASVRDFEAMEFFRKTRGK